MVLVVVGKERKKPSVTSSPSSFLRAIAPPFMFPVTAPKKSEAFGTVSAQKYFRVSTILENDSLSEDAPRPWLSASVRPLPQREPIGEKNTVF